MTVSPSITTALPDAIATVSSMPLDGNFLTVKALFGGTDVLSSSPEKVRTSDVPDTVFDTKLVTLAASVIILKLLTCCPLDQVTPVSSHVNRSPNRKSVGLAKDSSTEPIFSLIAAMNSSEGSLVKRSRTVPPSAALLYSSRITYVLPS